jgi:menaquinone-dependent protoporphyrinogen IX oxidase
VATAAERASTSAKTLVVYYSLTGNTARVARDIANRTGADLESLRDRDHGVGVFAYLKDCFDALKGKAARIAPLSHDPAQYDLTVIGTPVWVGRMTPAVRAYLQQTRGHLGRVAFFVTSGNTDVARLLPALEAVAQTQAVAAAGFSAPELKEQGVYEEKLSTLLNELQRERAAPAPPLTTSEHARAT